MIWEVLRWGNGSWVGCVLIILTIYLEVLVLGSQPEVILIIGVKASQGQGIYDYIKLNNCVFNSQRIEHYIYLELEICNMKVMETVRYNQ